jgi:hypothetical protein
MTEIERLMAADGRKHTQQQHSASSYYHTVLMKVEKVEEDILSSYPKLIGGGLSLLQSGRWEK